MVPEGQHTVSVGHLAYTVVMPPEQSDARQPDPLDLEDVASVSAAARWILGTAGAVATVLLAGFQVKDLGRRIEGDLWWQAWIPAVLSIVAVAIVFDIFRRAARVLVLDRISVDDLIRAEQKRIAHDRGIHVRSGKDGDREIWRVTPDLIDSVHMARGWLLPEGCSTVSDLAECVKRASAEDRPDLQARLREVLRFCRMEMARQRYRELVAAITGFRGWLFIACLAGLVIVTGSGHSSPPMISEPLRVRVAFSEGVGEVSQFAACAGQTVEGVAVGGSLTEPVVVFDSGECLGRFTITADVGTAIPMFDGNGQ